MSALKCFEETCTTINCNLWKPATTLWGAPQLPIIGPCAPRGAVRGAQGPIWHPSCQIGPCAPRTAPLGGPAPPQLQAPKWVYTEALIWGGGYILLLYIPLADQYSVKSYTNGLTDTHTSGLPRALLASPLLRPPSRWNGRGATHHCRFRVPGTCGVMQGVQM